MFAAGFLMRALGSLVFGHIGDTPMAAVHMIRHSGYDLAPAILIMATAAISFVVILGIRETSTTSLAGTVESEQAAFAVARQRIDSRRRRSQRRRARPLRGVASGENLMRWTTPDGIDVPSSGR